jgi:hypothetical protein
MGSMTSPTSLPATTPFDTLAGLIAIVADKDGAANTILALKKATDEHRVVEKTSINAKIEADKVVYEAQQIAARNAKDREALNAERAAFEAEKAAHESSIATRETEHASKVAAFSQSTTTSQREIAAMKKQLEENLALAKAASAQAAADRQATAKAREDAEAALNKLKPLMAAMGIVN